MTFRCFLLTVTALSVPFTAQAARGGSLTVKACDRTQTAQTSYPVRPATEVVPRVFVNGRELFPGRKVGRRSAEWSGYGVIAQLWQSSKAAPLTFRVASVRSGCATVRLNFVLH